MNTQNGKFLNKLGKDSPDLNTLFKISKNNGIKNYII